MLHVFIEKELREIVGSTKFAVTFGVGAVLLLLAFYVGAKHYEVGRAQYEAARTENLRQMEGLSTRRYFELEPRILLPPQPLAALVAGVSNDIGRTVAVQGQGALHAESSWYGDDPIYAVFRFLDLEFLFQIVFSLFAVLFAHDAVNGEKERGTLRLVFANPVPRANYILGKLIGSFLALTVPLLIPILGGCLLFAALGVPMTGAAWVRLGLVVLAGLLYVGVFLTLSVLVSALTHRSSSAFLVLLVVWIFAGFVYPRTAVLLAGRAVEVPSIDALLAQTSRFERQLFAENMQEVRRAMPRPGASETGGLVDITDEQLRQFQKRQQELADAREVRARQFRERLYEDRDNRLRRQQRVALGLARLSPAGAFSLAVTRLAGTSLDLKTRFAEAAGAYQEAFDRFLRAKTGGQSSGAGGAMIVIRRGGEEEEETFIDPREVPAFVFPDPPIGRLIEAALPDVGLLALFNLVFFGGAFVAFLRYDVR